MTLAATERPELIKKARPSCRVIFVTAYVDPRTVERMRGAQPDAILMKPAPEADIEEAIALAAAKIGDESDEDAS